MERENTDREYEKELQGLREQILLMGGRIEEMLNNSVRALVEKDSALAHRMIEYDSEIDAMELAIDAHCLQVLSQKCPTVPDVRFVTVALKIVTDLERIGDLGVNICERAIELNSQPLLKPYIDVPKMAEIDQDMIRDALDAFVSGNAEMARAVLERDHLVKAHYGQVFRELLTYMMEDPGAVSRGVKIQSVAKYLERIGDHATNLAELVFFMICGKDIRHSGVLTERRTRPHGVLFLCAQNSARSQMAEAWARSLFPTGVRIWSAGSRPAAEMDPRVEQVMKEVGVDCLKQKPKAICEVPLGDVDTIITLCEEHDCPVVPGEVRKQYWELPDPRQVGDGEQALEAFRFVRDELRSRIERLMERWSSSQH